MSESRLTGLGGGVVLVPMHVLLFGVDIRYARAENARWLLAPALFVLGVGLVLVPWASDFALMVAVIGSVWPVWSSASGNSRARATTIGEGRYFSGEYARLVDVFLERR